MGSMWPYIAAPWILWDIEKTYRKTTAPIFPSPRYPSAPRRSRHRPGPGAFSPSRRPGSWRRPRPCEGSGFEPWKNHGSFGEESGMFGIFRWTFYTCYDILIYFDEDFRQDQVETGIVWGVLVRSGDSLRCSSCILADKQHPTSECCEVLYWRVGVCWCQRDEAKFPRSHLETLETLEAKNGSSFAAAVAHDEWTYCAEGELRWPASWFKAKGCGGYVDGETATRRSSAWKILPDPTSGC